ncbi:MAG: hypothetical protein ABWX66_05275 [Lacisediminihabitans sp.]
MRSPRRAPALLVSATVTVALLAGCAAADWSAPHPSPSLLGSVGAGFTPPVAPTPEATVHPKAGTWDDAHPTPGYRVVLLTAGSDAPAHAIAKAVRDWAAKNAVDLRTVTANGNHIDGIVAAMSEKPDLIISAGNDLIDALAVVTASHLDQQFLVLGAEVAEPTANVTAVDWTGASFRGEGLGASSNFDPASFTAKRCGDAVRAGAASVLLGQTGVVLWID